MSTITVPAGLATLADELETARLMHRQRRILDVLGKLRESADEHARNAHNGKVPRPLQYAIRDFNIERMAIERRLEEL